MEAGYENRKTVELRGKKMEKKEKDSYVGMLLQTLQKQEETLREVLTVTKAQSKLADSDIFDEDRFQDTLNQKEILISRLNSLDDGFASVYGRVRNVIMQEKDNYRDEIRRMQELIKSCTDLGVEIKVLEERNRDKLAKCFSQKHKTYGARLTAATVASKYHQTMNSGQISGSNYKL